MTPKSSLLFPAVPRDFPLRRPLRTTLRSAHILATGVFLGGQIFVEPRDTLAPWLIASLATGLALLATDLHASFAVLLELRGAMVLAKIGALCLSEVFHAGRIPLLTGALVLGVVGSHMPRRFRHYLLLLRGQVTSDERQG